MSFSAFAVTGALCLSIALVEAWLLVALLARPEGALRRLVPNRADLVRSHIDYLMMALFLFVFYGLCRLWGREPMPWLIGAAYSVRASSASRASRPKPLSDIAVRAAFTITLMRDQPGDQMVFEDDFTVSVVGWASGHGIAPMARLRKTQMVSRAGRKPRLKTQSKDFEKECSFNALILKTLSFCDTASEPLRSNSGQKTSSGPERNVGRLGVIRVGWPDKPPFEGLANNNRDLRRIPGLDPEPLPESAVAHSIASDEPQNRMLIFVCRVARLDQSFAESSIETLKQFRVFGV